VPFICTQDTVCSRVTVQAELTTPGSLGSG